MWVRRASRISALRGSARFGNGCLGRESLLGPWCTGRVRGRAQGFSIASWKTHAPVGEPPSAIPMRCRVHSTHDLKSGCI